MSICGIEKPVSISKAQECLKLELKLAQELEVRITEENIGTHTYKFKRLLFQFTKRLQQMRTRLTRDFLMEQRLEKMKEWNPDCKDAFEYMLSLIFRNSTQIENCASRTLAANFDICYLLAEMRGSKCCVNGTKFVKLHKQPDYFGLLPSEYLSKHINLWKPENHIYCTQYSKMWWSLRDTALVTGSTLMKAVGFDTLMAEKEHVNVYVKKRPTPEIPDDVKKYIKFGQENEVHVINTFVGLMLPALKPKCYSFYEVGPQFIHSQT